MKRIASVMAATCLLGIVSEAREFTDAKGRKINAEIVGFMDDSIKMKIGRKTSTVKIDIFSKPDQIYIKEWILKNPSKAAYDFRFYSDLKEARNERKSQDGAAYDDKLRTRPHFYNVVISNANGVEMSGITIRYEIYINDMVDTVGNAYRKLAVGVKKQDKLLTIAGKMSNQKFDVKGRLEFNLNFDLHTYVDRDYGRVDQAAKDNTIGMRLRLYKGETLLDELTDIEDDSRFRKVKWQDKRAKEDKVVPAK